MYAVGNLNKQQTYFNQKRPISFFIENEIGRLFLQKIKGAPKLHGNRCLFSQRGWEKCSRSNKGVYVCYVIDFTILI